MMPSRPRLPSHALCSSEDEKMYERMTRDGVWKLSTSETIWVSRRDFLEKQGYIIRARYQKDWTPSWVGTSRDPMFCEDSIRLIRGDVIDARRAQDDALVSIKVVKADSREQLILSAFNEVQELRENSANHCVPLLALFLDPVNTAQRLLLMPYLDPFNKPPLETIQEVIDFVGQTLEGLEFMHSQGIAHRNITPENIVMDSKCLFPSGHHPVRRASTPDALYPAIHKSRLHKPVKYFFVDFSMSSFVDLDNSLPAEEQANGGRVDPTGMPANKPSRDLFCMDVYMLGMVYREEILTKYRDLEFLEPLVSGMTHPEPSCRLSAVVALDTIQSISSRKGGTYIRWRLHSRHEDPCSRVVLNTVDAAKAGFHHLKRMLSYQ